MTQIGSGQPVQYIPGVTNVAPTQSTGNIPQTQQSPPTTQNTSAGSSGYPYGEDVFKGQFEQFKGMYSNFNTDISQYSPFYGKMGSAQTNTNLSPQGNSPGATFPGGSTANGDLPPIPQSALTPQNNTGGNIPQQSTGDLPPIPQSALIPGTPGQNPQIQNVPATLPTPQNTNIPASGIPKKNIPTGPVITNIQQQLQAEAQKIQTPQKAMESIAGHAMISRQERTMANDIAWGARYYANQAQDLAQKLVQNKKSMSPGQVQSQLRTIENCKIKSISLLNDAKKKAINNYNEALKATMLYNNFFTEKGQYASIMNPNDRQFVESEIDKTWSTWAGGFEKEVNGTMVHADDSASVVDKAAQEIALAIDKADKASAAAQQN